MAAGLREDIELDISSALRDVDKLEAALTQTAKQAKVEFAKATEILRGPGGRFVARVDVDDHGSAKRVARDVEDIGDEAEQAEQASKRLGSSFDGVRTAIAGALAALGTRFVAEQIGQMISASSDLAESQSKVDVVFGESAAQIGEWGDTSAQAVGLAKQQALEAAGTFGNLFTALGLSQEAAAKLSPDVVQLGADFASFNNLEVPETLEKLRSGLVGEIEPLRSLGISFNAAQVEAKALELGLADANGEIGEGAKVQARWALITEQSAAATGDFARTSDGLANQQRILKAEIGNAQAEIGQRLLPAMLRAVEVGRGFLDFFLSLPGPVQNAVLAFVALGVALGPLLLAVGNMGKLVTAGKQAIDVIGGVGRAFASMNAVSALATSSAVLAIVGIAVAANMAAESITSKLSRAISELADVSTKELVQSFDESGRSLRDFRLIAEQDVVTAKRLRDGMADLGMETSALDEIIAEQVAKQAALEAETSAASAAIDGQKAAVTGATGPTGELADATGTLADEIKATNEALDAFGEALDAALGVYLSSEQATIRVRQRVDELAKAYVDGRKDGETLQQFQDRLTLSTHDVTDAVTKEVEALVRDGTVSADAASQKEAIISRLNALADVMGGPMAKELREHAVRVASIPDEAITNVSADTSAAKAALGEMPGYARQKGEQTGNEFTSGMAAGVAGVQAIGRLVDRVRYTVAAAVAAARGPGGFDSSSPSKVGESIGGEFVEGIALGVERDAELAAQQSAALAGGFEEIWRQAATLSAEESLAIWTAMDAVREAQARLTWIRADARATAEQLYRAEIELARAQEQVNDAVFDGRDASDELTEAMREQERAAQALNDSLDGALGALDALNGMRGAQNSLRRAEQQLAEAQARQSALPSEIADAERNLAAARVEATAVTASEALAITRARLAVTRAEQSWAEAQADATLTADERTAAEQELAVARENLTRTQQESTSVTNEVEQAERALAELRKEQVEIVNRVSEASQRLQSAQLDVVAAQRQLIEAGEDLTGTEAGMVSFFEQIARQAGLSRGAIRDLVASMREAIEAAESGYAPRIPGVTPLPEVFRPRLIRDANSDGRVTAAESLAHVEAMIARWRDSRGMSVVIQPKTAVYDAKQTKATLQTLELLS